MIKATFSIIRNGKPDTLTILDENLTNCRERLMYMAQKSNFQIVELVNKVTVNEEVIQADQTPLNKPNWIRIQLHRLWVWCPPLWKKQGTLRYPRWNWVDRILYKLEGLN